MSRRCELTAKGPLVGHKVSHSNIKTKRTFEPNLVKVSLASDTLDDAVEEIHRLAIANQMRSCGSTMPSSQRCSRTRATNAFRVSVPEPPGAANVCSR